VKDPACLVPGIVGDQGSKFFFYGVASVRIDEDGVDGGGHERQGQCRYPADRIPPHAGFKSRQGARRASTRYHVLYSPRLCLPGEVGSSATTCPTAPDPASLSRWTLTCHVSSASGPRLPAEPGSDAAMCPGAPDPASLPGWTPASPRVLRL
jgi:hypothetical protein